MLEMIGAEGEHSQLGRQGHGGGFADKGGNAQPGQGGLERGIEINYGQGGGIGKLEPHREQQWRVPNKGDQRSQGDGGGQVSVPVKEQSPQGQGDHNRGPESGGAQPCQVGVTQD